MASTTARQAPKRESQNPENDKGMQLTPGILLLILIAFYVLTKVGPLVVSVLMAWLLGTILEGPVQRLQKRGLPRGAAIAVCYVAILATIVGLVFIVFPVVQNQATEFRDTFPEQMHTLYEEWRVSSNPLLRGSGASLLKRGIDFLESPETSTTVSGDTAARAIPIVGTLVGAITSLITTLVITFYYLLEKKLVRRVIIDMLRPSVQPRVDAIWSDVEFKVGGWLRGQLVLCAIIGTLATISYGVIGLNFWPLLGLWAGLTEIIPIVGPWLGGIPAVIVALTMGVDKAIMVAVIIVTMQSLENWILVPRVMRGAVGLTPLTVFVAILAGTQVMGIVGAVLAIPLAAGAQVILTDFMENRRSRYAMEPVHSGSWRWMLSRATDRQGGYNISNEEDHGTQIESEATYAAEQTEPESVNEDEDVEPVEFEEAPSIIGDEVEDEAKSHAAEATWPAREWRPRGSMNRANTPWRAAFRSTRDKDHEE